jgi:hypothetical protein
MADAYSIAFPITTAGYTGSVTAFISTASSAHNVSFVPTKGASTTQTINAQPGVVYPIKCSYLKPTTSTILGLNP